MVKAVAAIKINSARDAQVPTGEKVVAQRTLFL
jgi:hypothetical protein